MVRWSKKSGIQECYLRWDQTVAFFFLVFFLSLFVCVLVCQGDRLVVWSHSLWAACAENLPSSQTFVIQESSSRAAAKLWQRRWLTHAHALACAEWRQAGQHRWARRGKRVDVLWGNGSPLVFIFPPIQSSSFLSTSIHYLCLHSSPFHSSHLLLIPFHFIPLLSCLLLFIPMLYSSLLFIPSFYSPPSSFLRSPLLSSPLPCAASVDVFVWTCLGLRKAFTVNFNR